MGMDCHVAGLMIGIMFKETYKPISNTVNVLNTVAEQNRQLTIILPGVQNTASIPVGVNI